MASSELEAQSVAANAESAAKFCGWAKIPTNSLLFYPDFACARVISQRDKVERLKRIFSEEGCHRQSTCFCIPGDIDTLSFREALTISGVTENDLRRREDPPRIFLPTGSFIKCAYGSSRVHALEQIQPHDQWWTIELHRGMCVVQYMMAHTNNYKDLSLSALKIISETYENSGRYSDGHIFARICQYRPIDPAREKQWWSRVSSKSKRDILKRFTGHTSLASPYSQVLLKIPGMRDRLQISSLPEIMAARSVKVK